MYLSKVVKNIKVKKHKESIYWKSIKKYVYNTTEVKYH